READQTHPHPVHGASPCCGFPHAPPPGVSMRSTSPGASSVFTLDATGVPFKIVRPAAPCPPSAAPAGSWRRRSASTLSSIGASASNSRTTPSPPPAPTAPSQGVSPQPQGILHFQHLDGRVPCVRHPHVHPRRAGCVRARTL